MILSDEQQAAVVAVLGLRKGEVLVISGYAGTGKSTVLAHLLKSTQVDAVLTPTGKAAARLRQLGVLAARTLHSALYVPVEGGSGGPQWCRKEDTRIPKGGLVVVDEASMVTARVAFDLRNLAEELELRLVFVGDGFQLPPVAGPGEVFSLMESNGVFPGARAAELTQVYRQAADSPVLAAATAMRHGESAPPPPDQGAYLVKPGGTTDTATTLVRMLRAGVDAIGITWRNEDRHSINRAVRRALGRTAKMPEIGEPLMVLHNVHPLGLSNGEIVTVVEYPDGDVVEPLPGADGVGLEAVRAIVADPMGGTLDALLVPAFLGGHPKLQPADPYTASFGIDSTLRARMLVCDWGYCATAHKAQGSEWDVVVVHLSGGLRQMADDWRLWVYTAMTRAREGLVVYCGSDAYKPVFAARRAATGTVGAVYVSIPLPEFSSRRAGAAVAAVRVAYPDARVDDCQVMDLARRAKDGGWDLVYRQVVEDTDAVAVLEAGGHVGKGSYTVVCNALRARKPVVVVRDDRLVPVRDAVLVDADDWKFNYGRLVV